MEPQYQEQFWGCTVAANSSETESLELSELHVSNVALKNVKVKNPVVVKVTTGDNTFTLCTLSKEIPQYAVELIAFPADERRGQ